MWATDRTWTDFYDDIKSIVGAMSNLSKTARL